jgi:hypothetical protein
MPPTAIAGIDSTPVRSPRSRGSRILPRWRRRGRLRYDPRHDRDLLAMVVINTRPPMRRSSSSGTLGMFVPSFTGFRSSVRRLTMMLAALASYYVRHLVERSTAALISALILLGVGWNPLCRRDDVTHRNHRQSEARFRRSTIFDLRRRDRLVLAG